jgi:hypothetical protein
MHAGTEGGGGGGADEEQPDPNPRDGEEQCDEEVGGADEAAASMSADVRSDEAAADGKPSARASASAAASAKGSGSGGGGGEPVKRKKPKPKHQRSQKPEGYPSRNRYVNRVLLRIDRPVCLFAQLICMLFLYFLPASLRRSSYNYFFQGKKWSVDYGGLIDRCV